MTGLVLRDDAGPVAVLTLNRPDKLNALSPDVFADLCRHLDDIERDPAVRCVVLKGAGRSFCAGADIEALDAGLVTDDPEFRSKSVARLGAIRPIVVAAVHGHCYTGGLELACTADVIAAAADARFCDTHARLGIVPRWGLSARLPRRVGLAAARRMSLTCEPLTSEEALRIGLCDYVVPRDELDDFAFGLATRAAENDPHAVAGIRHLYGHALDVTLAEALDYERAYTPTPGARTA